MVLLDPLLLEGESLVFEGLFTLEVDLSLSEFVHGLVILELELLDLGGESGFFGLHLLSELVNELVLAFHLTSEAVFLILKAEDCAFSFRYLRS